MSGLGSSWRLLTEDLMQSTVEAAWVQTPTNSGPVFIHGPSRGLARVNSWCREEAGRVPCQSTSLTIAWEKSCNREQTKQRLVGKDLQAGAPRPPRSSPNLSWENYCPSCSLTSHQHSSLHRPWQSPLTKRGSAVSHSSPGTRGQRYNIVPPAERAC